MHLTGLSLAMESCRCCCQHWGESVRLPIPPATCTLPLPHLQAHLQMWRWSGCGATQLAMGERGHACGQGHWSALQSGNWRQKGSDWYTAHTGTHVRWEGMRAQVSPRVRPASWWHTFCDNYRYTQKGTDSLVHEGQQNHTPSFLPAGRCCQGQYAAPWGVISSRCSPPLPAPPAAHQCQSRPGASLPCAHSHGRSSLSLSFSMQCNSILITLVRSPGLLRQEDRFWFWKYGLWVHLINHINKRSSVQNL